MPNLLRLVRVMTLHPEQCRHQDVPGKTGCRIAGVVVLYRPDEEVTATISTYIEQVDMLIAIDNSEYDTTPTTAGLRQLDTVTFVANGRNLGVAGALNMGARMALECGCEYLLTMDQDSRATPGMVLTMLRVFSSSEQGAIGIVAPFLVTRPGEKPDGTIDCLEMQSVMTSGNLLNLRAYEAAGPFMEELFVDFVDIEYCLRLRSSGFRVVRANRALLEHRVGTLLRFRVFFHDLYLTSHSPLRKYYKTRNRFFVGDRYRQDVPSFRRKDRLRFVLELVRLLFFESGKREKLAMMRKGYADYRRGRMGKYDDGAGGACP